MVIISSCRASRKSVILGKFNINAFDNEAYKCMLAGTIFWGDEGHRLSIVPVFILILQGTCLTRFAYRENPRLSP